MSISPHGLTETEQNHLYQAYETIIRHLSVIAEDEGQHGDYIAVAERLKMLAFEPRR